MIDMLLSGLGFALSGAGLWGVALKLAARFGISWLAKTATGPIGSVVGAVAEGVVDIIVTLIKAVFGYIGKWVTDGLDYISKDFRAATVATAIAWSAFYIGQAMPSAPAQSPVAQAGQQKAKPAQQAQKQQPAPAAERKCYLPPFLDQLC